MFFLINKKRKNWTDKGFTLIETFVAITILLIAITGPLYLVTRGVALSKSVKGQVTAVYLAQEAVEYIRNIRDKNILSGNDWLATLGDCVSGKCKIDSPAQEVTSCGTDCAPLKYNDATKLYGYNLGEETVFKRDIQINEITAGKEIEIIVIMSWSEGPNEKQFTMKEYLLNWQ